MSPDWLEQREAAITRLMQNHRFSRIEAETYFTMQGDSDERVDECGNSGSQKDCAADA